LKQLHSEVNWRHGVKTALAAGLCLGLGRLLGLKQEYWACMATIVVMQLESVDTVTASRDRLLGTALGTFVGWGASVMWHGHVIVYAIAVLCCMVVPELIGLHSPGRLAGMAATIVMLVPNTDSRAKVARDRFIEVSFGILVALVVSQTLWRKTTMERIPPLK
jgi:uncharacterized membrane protein YccC